MQNVYEKLISCYESIQEKIPFTPKVALVLGSGLGDYAEEIRVEAELDYHEIDGFPVSTDMQENLFLDGSDPFRWCA